MSSVFERPATPALERVGSLRARRNKGDDGAVLILAFVMLLVGLIIIGSLTYAVSNDVSNASHFKVGRSLQYAATSATDQAIQSIRYTPLLGANQTLNASPPSYCWGSGPLSQLTNIDGVSGVTVWCSTDWNPTSTTTRVVTISTCLSGVTATACAQNPVLQAVVTFDDYPPGVSQQTSTQCVVYCGSSVTINSWQRGPTVPTLTAISTTTGPSTGGTSLTITGTGFVTGSTVNFTEELLGSPSSDNVVLPATNVVVVNSTTITASTPPITVGQSYFVSVVTPTGFTPFNSSGVFTYNAVLPSVTALSATTGSTAGGTSLTITGSGFVFGSAVGFIEENGGNVVSPKVEFFATNVTVTSNSTITAITPGVTAATTFFVVVSTPGGVSATSTPNVFTFSPLVPTASMISPTSGPTTGGTSITITGSGFVVGATVQFVEENNGNVVQPMVSLSGTSVVVLSATSITCVTPPITKGQTYFVTVSTPTGTSNYYPVFTF